MPAVSRRFPNSGVPTSIDYTYTILGSDPVHCSFTTRDMYMGALADTNLGADPFTGNRYAPSRPAPPAWRPTG